MPLHRAVVLLDHHSAGIHEFDDDQSQSKHVKDQQHDTRQHNSAVRTQHEFFGDVCDALAGITEVLMVGSHIVRTDFTHYVEKHRAAVAPQIAGWDDIDHPTDNELVALGRKFFAAHDRMAGTRPIH
ncbi:MAG: hypothetical protein ABI442_16390 [Gemmatimonadaceae bacterium]